MWKLESRKEKLLDENFSVSGVKYAFEWCVSDCI